MSVSVDGTYWSVIVFNKDQLTHPACVQFMGENQQSTLATIFNAKAQEDVQSLDLVNTDSRPQSTMSLHPVVIVVKSCRREVIVALMRSEHMPLNIVLSTVVVLSSFGK